MADKKEFVNTVSFIPWGRSLTYLLQPVVLNDICEFPDFALGTYARKLPVNWSQSLEERKENYTLVVFDISPKGKKINRLT